jgi:hypothetical protein
LFRPAARFAELGVVHPETDAYVSYGVYLLTEHPFDALHKYIPSDAQVLLRPIAWNSSLGTWIPLCLPLHDTSSHGEHFFCRFKSNGRIRVA